MAKTALVTGSNRGLGLETVKQLAVAGFHVIGTSREESSGRKVIEGLGKERDVVWEPLDIADEASVAALAQKLEKDKTGLDVLVNNAGISMKGFNAQVAEGTNAVNFFGTMHVTDALLPLIRDKGRIVNVSSGMGELGSNYSEEVKKRFLDPEINRETLVRLVKEFIRDVAAEVHADRGWPSSAYRVSKAALNTYTRIVAKELAPRGVLVNAVCPGWVKTDMGGPSASRDLETGGRSIVWAALIPDDGPTGGFFRDGKQIPW